MAEPAVGRLISLAGAGTAAAERCVPAPRPLDRSGAARRSARERNVLRGARLRARRPRVGGHQRAASRPDDRRRRVVAGVRLRDPTRRDLPGRAALRHLLDEPARAGVGLRHGGRIQRRLACARRAGRRRRRHRRARSAARAVWRAAARCRDRCRRRPGRSRTSWRSCRRSASSCRSSSSASRPSSCNVALTRALALQRSQIAALKALGYSNGELAWHYIKWALAIARPAPSRASAAGAWLGVRMIGLYNEFFRFPVARLPSVGRRRRRRRSSASLARRRARRAVRGSPRRPRSAGRGDAARSRRRGTVASVLERHWRRGCGRRW